MHWLVQGTDLYLLDLVSPLNGAFRFHIYFHQGVERLFDQQ